jgi:hypothetical protein
VKSQGQRSSGHKWKRPEGVSQYSPLPRIRWNEDDPEMDVKSPNQRLIYKFLCDRCARTTKNEFLQPALVRQSHAAIASKTGLDPKTVQRGIYALIRKCSIVAWEGGKEVPVPEKGSPTGRQRGEAGHPRVTTYRVLPAAEALARRSLKYVPWYEYNREGELKPRWLTIGWGRRILTAEECGGPPKGWNADEYFAHRKEAGKKRAERDERRAAREVGEPPDTAADVPMPARAEQETPPAQQPAAQVSADGGGDSSAPVNRGEPPKGIRDAIRKFTAASYVEIWRAIDQARTAADEIGWAITDEDLGFVANHAGLRVGKVKNCAYFSAVMPDLIRSNPHWKPPPPAEVEAETTKERIERLAWAIAKREDANFFPELREDALALLKAADPSEVELAREIYDAAMNQQWQRRIEQLLADFKTWQDEGKPHKERYAAEMRVRAATPEERDAVERFVKTNERRLAAG